MVSSPYVRAMQTAAIFASALDYPKQKIRRADSLLPGAEPAASYGSSQEKRTFRPYFVSVTLRTWTVCWQRRLARSTTSRR